MPLDVGTNLGTYTIQAAIGTGGMGEVYRAKDTKLGREVAIKVLHEALRQDEERLARFEREARVLASLNHPGIATLYGLETEGSITYLVMELVHGDTLQERLARGPLTVEEAIAIFQQIAEALEAAHAAGVVHRDLKPANIKITPEGRVKILDFGLAKAFATEDDEPVSDLSSSPTLTRGATAVGVIMGTASYMSPEQARGKKADKRADIWAFGCVLFEAISGKKAFDGESVTDVLANVIHKDVLWEALPAETPWRVRDVLRRCLVKDAGQRFHDVADARLELLADERPPTWETQTTAPKSRLLVLGLLMGLVVAVAVAVAAFFLWKEPPPGGEVQAFVITPPASESPLSLETPMISPDGRRIVYIGVQEDDRHLYLRELDELGSRLLAGTEGAHSPFFSPDGLWVGFFAGGKIKKVSVLGGAPIDICNVYAEGPGGSWAPDDTIWFSGNWFLRGLGGRRGARSRHDTRSRTGRDLVAGFSPRREIGPLYRRGIAAPIWTRERGSTSSRACKLATCRAGTSFTTHQGSTRSLRSIRRASSIEDRRCRFWGTRGGRSAIFRYGIDLVLRELGFRFLRGLGGRRGARSRHDTRSRTGRDRALVAGFSPRREIGPLYRVHQ